MGLRCLACGHLGAAEAVLDALVHPEGPVYYAV